MQREALAPGWAAERYPLIARLNPWNPWRFFSAYSAVFFAPSRRKVLSGLERTLGLVVQGQADPVNLPVKSKVIGERLSARLRVFYRLAQLFYAFGQRLKRSLVQAVHRYGRCG